VYAALRQSRGTVGGAESEFSGLCGHRDLLARRPFDQQGREPRTSARRRGRDAGSLALRHPPTQLYRGRGFD